MTSGNGDRREKLAEWRGGVNTKLEGVEKDLAEIKSEVHQIREKLDSLRITVAGVSGSITVVLNLIFYFIQYGGT